jgi:zinc-binding alcohol dehydrogenase family protein
MKGIGLYEHLPINHPNSLVDLTLPLPAVGSKDLLVRIEAISVNPVDYKIRSGSGQASPSNHLVLGWDAAGVVEAFGSEVHGFNIGDAVYYAGDVSRAGSNAQYQAVDYRIVGRKPKSLSFVESASVPLTALTAYEGLFERLKVKNHESILIIGGAGGVGSIAIQLAKNAGLTVLATVGRPESHDWVMSMGANHALDHHQELRPQIEALGLNYIDHILNLNNTDFYWDVMADLIRPEGLICSIVENEGALNQDSLKRKSAGFVWEFMFTKSLYQTPDIATQGEILNKIAEDIDRGALKTTVSKVFQPISVLNLKQAHELLESRTTIGKIVLHGWD